MYKKNFKTLKAFLNMNSYTDELFSRSSMNTIIRALLEPVANQNISSLVFTRFKNKDGLGGLIKRLEYCNNVEMVDVLEPKVLVKDDLVELEFIIFTSARYSFALIWDYSFDKDKNYTKTYFLVNSRGINDIFDSFSNLLSTNYSEKFYSYRPERRENELLNEALFNVLRKLNNSIEENDYTQNEGLIVDLTEEENNDERLKEVCHEIKNQLSIMDVYLGILENKSVEKKFLSPVKKALSAINTNLYELRNFEEPKIEDLFIEDVIDDLVSTYKEVLLSNNNSITVENKLDMEPKVFADENKLMSVFGNILKNANEACNNDSMKITLSNKDEVLKIEFENHGTPIDSNNASSLFEKNFTTKKKGSGFGLYFAKKYIESVNGKLFLQESSKEKTVFCAELPLH